MSRKQDRKAKKLKRARKAHHYKTRFMNPEKREAYWAKLLAGEGNSIRKYG